jgi:hypothetical protein
VSPGELAIIAGDFVLWSADSQSVPHYAILGEGTAFASDRLLGQSLYTHIFGTAGDYEWVDAHGSAVSGRVSVAGPRGGDQASMREWQAASAQPALILIKDGRAQPAELRIVVNQQVFFAVEDGPGITVTDKRQLRPETDSAPRGAET